MPYRCCRERAKHFKNWMKYTLLPEACGPRVMILIRRERTAAKKNCRQFVPQVINLDKKEEEHELKGQDVPGPLSGDAENF